MVATLFHFSQPSARAGKLRPMRIVDAWLWFLMVVAPAMVLASVASVGFATPSTVAAIPAMDDRAWIPVGPGVHHASFALSSTDSQQSVNVLRVDRGVPYISLVASIGRGQVEGTETVLTQASRYNASRPDGVWTGDAGGVTGVNTAVVGGVNADFFASTPIVGLPIGLHVQDGEIVISPNDRPAFGVFRDGQPIIGVPRMSGEVWREHAPSHAAGDARLGGEQSDELFLRATIHGVNRPPNGLGLVLYTPRFGWETPAIAGTVVTVRGVIGPITSGQVFSGVVARKETGRGTSPVRAAIPADGVVLAARGPAEVLLEELALGEWVQFRVELAQPFGQVANAVAGWPILVQDGQILPLNSADSLVGGRHPRTAVGFNDRYVFLVTVDGRQAGHADGMTLPELARFMLALGATEALNLDGGGSTTMVVRPPGQERPALANRPSDGHQRAVGNALLVISTAPPGPLASLHVRPSADAVLVGAAMPIEVLGQDLHNNPIPVDASQITWSVRGNMGKVESMMGTDAAEETGATVATFAFVAHEPGTALITARVGNTESVVAVDVVPSVVRVELTPDTIHLGAGETVVPEVRAFDAAGRRVWVDPRQLMWYESPLSAAGTRSRAVVHVDFDGRITGVSAGKTTLHARLGQAVGAVAATVDRPPMLLSGFETTGQWFANAVRAQAAFSVTGPPEPVRSGGRAGKLVYDLSVSPGGTAAAYVQATTPIPIPDRPRALGIWVYGDESGHWLRGSYFDGEDNRQVLDFTAVGGLDWRGWRFVEAEIPPDAVLPLTFERVYVVEMHRDRQTPGVLYFDDLVALYGPM